MEDGRFKKAVTEMDEIYTKSAKNNGFMPEEVSMYKISEWIFDFYTDEEKNERSKPRRQQPTTVDMLLPQVNAMTRSQGRRQNQRSSDSYTRHDRPYQRRNDGDKPYQRRQDRDNDKPPRGSQPRKRGGVTKPPNNARCGCCGKKGHETDNCPHRGQALKIRDYLAKLTPREQSRVLKDYLDHTDEVHERYVKAYNQRARIRSSVSCLDVDMDAPDYPTIRAAHIEELMAEKDYDDVDFMTMDPDLVDDEEPYLDFDPDDNHDVSQLWSIADGSE